MWNLKRHDTNELTYKMETDSQTSRMNLGLPGGRMEGRGSQGVWDGHVYTAIFKMDNQQGPTIQHWELYSILFMNQPGQEGSLGEKGHMDIYGESHCCPPETITTLLIGCTPI